MAYAQQPEAALTAVALLPSHADAPQVPSEPGASQSPHGTWTYRSPVSPPTNIWAVILASGSADQAWTRCQLPTGVS